VQHFSDGPKRSLTASDELYTAVS